MRFAKRTLSLMLVLLMISALFSISVSAVTVYSGDFGFSINGSTMEATVVEYSGSDTEVQIPSKVYNYNVTAVDDSLFSDNTTVKTVTIPSSITTLGDSVFSGCTSLSEITVPSTVTSTGKSLFRNCTSLKTVYFNATVSALPQSAFYNCSSLENVTLADNITQIGNSAFYNCSSLTYVPSIGNLTSIGQNSFYKSGIRELVLPSTVTSLPRYAFANCTQLEKVLVPATVTTIDSTAFANSESVKIFCYEDSFAHTYAESEGILYGLLKVGNVNLDSNIDVKDATEIQKYIAGLNVIEEFATEYADVNGDNVISVIDATNLQKYLAGLIQ